MDMESVSSQLLARYSLDRTPETAGQSSRQDNRIDGHRRGHQADHAHRNEPGHGLESRKNIEDKRDAHRHEQEKSGDISALTYRRSERSTLMIETQEGDIVRLKIKASESLSINTGQSEEDGTTISEFELQAQSRIRVTFKVKGELNGEELAAIQAVIEQAGNLANDFFAGNTDDAFATASALEIDATQLANVRIRMKSSEQLTYPMIGNLPKLVSSQPEPESDPATGELPVMQEQGTATNGAGTAAEAGSEATAPDVQASEGTATVTADEAANPPQLMANVLQSIGTFLNNLLGALGSNDDEPGSSISPMNMTLKLQLFRSMLLSISEMEKPAMNEPATALAADTIDAVTAQQAPLDAIA